MDVMVKFDQTQEKEQGTTKRRSDGILENNGIEE